MGKIHDDYSLLCDYYEFVMANGYFKKGMKDRILYFDVFFRSVPDKGGFAIAAGLEQIVEYINNLHFNAEAIALLRSKGCFDADFLDYLANFKFSGDIYAVPEGTVVFPREPILTVRAPAIEAQLIETFVLMSLNHQSLIATKANRIVRAADGRAVMEFGARRAQGAQAAYIGARAAYIAGCVGSSCVLTDLLSGVPALGTMAHSWVQTFDDEYEAFKAFCDVYPGNASLLVDTYNVLDSGMPAAIKVFKELGITKGSVRIDSGDITYLTKKMRSMLDAEGLTGIKIIVSNSLDENIILDVINQGSCIDSFGVGERLITSKSDPVFGGVYKLAALEDEQGNIIPKIKISENVDKITNPHFKKLYRLYEKDSGKAAADLICIHDETVSEDEPVELFDPEYVWKRKTLTDFTARELLLPIFRNGEQVYSLPQTDEIRSYCLGEVDSLWEEVKRFENPHNYYVDLSQRLWDEKQRLLMENGKRL